MKQKIEALTDDYISYDRYKKICEKAGLTVSARRTLVQYLSDLGVALHFTLSVPNLH